MGVKVAFQSADNGQAKSTRSSFIIPKSAVQRSDDRDIVWVVRDGRVERRAVTIEQTTGDETVISAGLNNGERVIIKAPAEIAEGSRVTEKKS
jgi:hypothetical protein